MRRDPAIPFIASGQAPETDPAQVQLLFGQLSDSTNPTTIEDSMVSYAMNADRSQRTVRLALRPRQWAASPASNPGIIGCAMTSIEFLGTECDRIVAMFGTGPGFEFRVLNLGLSGGTSVPWGPAFGAGSESAPLYPASWQHYTRAYFAGGPVRFATGICGSSPTTGQLFRSVPFNESIASFTATEIATSDYLITFPTWGTDAIGSDRGGPSGLGPGRVRRWTSATAMGTAGLLDSEDDFTIEGGNLIWVLDAEVSGTYNCDGTYIWQANQDWRSVSFITIHVQITGTQCDFTGVGDSDFKLVLKPDTGPAVDLPLEDIDRVSATNVYATYNARSLTMAQRQVIREIGFLTRVRKFGGVGWQADMVVKVYVGGQNYNLQSESSDKFSATSLPQLASEYFVRYRTADSLTQSRALRRVVDYFEHRGARVTPNLPYMGTRVTGAVQVAGSPWDATSFIDVYRKVTVRGSGETRYYRVLDGASNASTQSFTDVWADRDLLDSAIPYLTEFPLEGSQLSGGVPVSNVSCGASWKGANVLGTRDGYLLFSRVNTQDDFAWPGTVYPFEAGALDDPRTEQVTPDGLPIMGLVASDALYIFSRYGLFIMNGETPATAGHPQRITDVAGLLSPRGCSRFGSGALFASDDGLYYVAAPFREVGASASLEYREVTKDIRASWLWLKGNSWSNLSVASGMGTILVVNGDRALYMDKNEIWTRMHVDSGGAILAHCANQHARYGMQVISTQGRVAVLAPVPSDWGTNAGGTNGSPASWSVATKRWVDYVRVTRMYLGMVLPHSQDTLEVTITTDRGIKTITVADPNSLRYNVPVSVGSQPPAGRWLQLTFSGNASTEMESARVDLVRSDPRKTK